MIGGMGFPADAGDVPAGRGPTPYLPEPTGYGPVGSGRDGVRPCAARASPEGVPMPSIITRPANITHRVDGPAGRAWQPEHS